MREEKGRVGISKGSRWQGRMSKMVWLLEEKRVTYHDAVAVYDGVEPVSDGDHPAISELVLDRPLDQFVRPMVGNAKLRLEEQHRARKFKPRWTNNSIPAGQTHSTTSSESMGGTWGRRWLWPHR